MSTLEHAVGRRVAQLRRAAGWSQTELATLAGIGAGHQSTISKLEKAQRPISVNELCVLAGVFGLSPAELLGEGPTPTGVVNQQSRLRAAAAERAQVLVSLSRAEEHLAALRASLAWADEQVVSGAGPDGHSA